jgi:hypothetical protein
VSTPIPPSPIPPSVPYAAPPTGFVSPEDVPSVVNDIRYGLSEAGEAVDSIIGNAEAFLSGLPDFVAGDLPAAVADLRRRSTDLVNSVNDQLATVGDPALLRATAEHWSAMVGGLVSRISGTVDLDDSGINEKWAGEAATAYRETLGAQKTAIDTVTMISKGITDVLNNLADGISTYWTQVSAAMLGYGAVIAGAAITAATGAGAPAGVAFALLAAGSAITALGVALNALTTVTNTAITSSSALMNRFNDDTGFRNGAWPRSTALDPSSPAATSLADGSLSDGDDTNWHLQ